MVLNLKIENLNQINLLNQKMYHSDFILFIILVVEVLS